MGKTNTLKDPASCQHTATHRVSGTRDLWHCIQCGGMLKDNVTLLAADPDPEPGKGGLIAHLKSRSSGSAKVR